MVIAAVAAAALLAAMPLTAAPSPVSSREIVEITDLSSLAISPDGRTVAYRAETASIDRNDYRLDWYVAPVDGSARPRRVADAGEGNRQNGVLLSDPPAWTRDSRWLVFRSVADGEVQLWHAAADGSRVERLTSDAGNIKAFVVADDDGSIVYEAGAARADIVRAEQSEYDHGIRIDSRIDPQRPLTRSARIEGRVASDRLHGFWFANGDILADQPHRYLSLDLATRTVRAATATETRRLGPPHRPFETVGDRLVLARADSGDRRGSAVALASGLASELSVRRETAQIIRCTRPACLGRPIVNVAWQRDADRVLFTTSDTATNQALHLWDVAAGTVRTLVSATGRLNGGRDDLYGCAIGSRTVVCTAAAANVPPQLIAVDFATGKRRTIADPNAGLIRAGAPIFEPLRWRDGAGHEFTGQLMLPRDRRTPAPLFVTYYLCEGYLRGGTGDEFPLRQLVDSGIAALCINRAPSPPGLGDQVAQYHLALAGVQSAIALLAALKSIDPSRVGMGGLSFGGEVTAWVATHSNLLAAASIASTLITPTYYWFSAMVGLEPLKTLKQVWGLDDPDKTPAAWAQVSPALTVDTLQAPLLMQMPEQEFRSNVELAARLRLSSKPIDLWAFADEPHVKYQPRHKLAVYQRNLDWFRYWLQAYVDPDPAKQSQYKPWQAYERQPGWHAVDDQASLPPSAATRPSSQPRNQASVSMTGSKR